MRRWPRSSSLRLGLLAAAAFFAGSLVLGGGMYLAVSALLLDDARQVIRADAGGLLELEREAGPQALATEIGERVEAPYDPDAAYALIAADGRLLGGHFARLPHFSANARWVEFVERRGDGERVRVVANLATLPDGDRLLTGLRTRSQDRFLQLILDSAFGALLVATVIGALFGWWIARWVAARLSGIDRIAARVGAGELGLRVADDGSGDAFNRLARRFNAMLDRIEDLLAGVRHATDHIAHDLRTPLTRLRQRLELLRDAPRIAGDDLQPAIDEADRLLGTAQALLRLARIEAEPPALDAPRVVLAALLDDAAELYQPVAAERGIRLQVVPQDLGVHGDRDQLFQMLVNLIDNAIKFAPDGSRVALVLADDGAMACLSVEDHGPGIPAEERERVFDRFQRLEAHRGSPGAGLGLSLVRAIVLRHGGSIRLDDAHPGLRVRVWLPRG
jgi:signal transduction histidine kinase